MGRARTIGWNPITTVVFDGKKIEVLCKDGSVTTLYANPEWKPESRLHHTHWRKPK